MPGAIQASRVDANGVFKIWRLRLVSAFVAFCFRQETSGSVGSVVFAFLLSCIGTLCGSMPFLSRLFGSGRFGCICELLVYRYFLYRWPSSGLLVFV